MFKKKLLKRAAQYGVTQSREELCGDERCQKTLKGFDIRARGKGGTTITLGQKSQSTFRRCLKYPPVPDGTCPNEFVRAGKCCD